MSDYNNNYNNSEAASVFNQVTIAKLKRLKSSSFNTQYNNYMTNSYGSYTTDKNWSNQHSMPSVPPSVESIKNMTYQSDSLGPIPF